MVNRIIDFSVRNKFLVFAVVAVACVIGWWSMKHVGLDAIPDLSDTQVIVYSTWDRSPDIVEDQVTYPIISAMLGAPHVKAVRGFSDFGSSFVYVIFEEGTDIYWARSRTLEYLSGVLPGLPQGVKTELGPDANGLGWIFQYALVDKSGRHSLAELRSFQDWYMRYYLKSVPGVAEIAPLGGFEQQYQINLDPSRLQAYGIPLSRVVEAVRAGNSEVGGRLLEFGGTEYMVRGRGYAKSLHDFENIVLTAGETATPVRVKDVGQVVLAPELRRGVSDLDGNGEVVSGIVIMRQGENALQVIDRVKAKLNEIGPGLPSGVEVVPIYDRSDLVRRSISNLQTTLIEVLFIVALVVLLFLWHVPSALIPLITIPVSVLLAFIPFRMLGLTANIMSLGGIAIAIGALVDASIVVVEQAHKKLEEWERTGSREDYRDVVLNAIKQVAAPSFFALLVIAVSFLPVLTLEAQEGRLFRPLAYTKTLAMVIAAVLAITLAPALCMLFTRRRKFHFRPAWLCRWTNALVVGSIHAQEKHPITGLLIRWYHPLASWALRWSWAVIAAAVLLVAVTLPVFQKLGSELMPPLEEGSILYMPSTAPGISLTEAQKVLQVTDRILKQFPEVDRVLGKAGRAETATDPAPLSMLETVIILKPHSQWRTVDTWYSSWTPQWAKPVLRHVTPDHISQEELIRQMNEALKVPGLANVWTMPVKGRTDMLTTGVRTPVALKISGADVQQIEKIGMQAESLLSSVEGTRSVFAERTGGGYFLDIDWNRDELARYGLSMEEVQTVIQHAIGGENVTTVVQGRERYPVNVRYMRDFRSDLSALSRMLVPVSGGQGQVPLAQLATIRPASGPAMLRNENGLLTGYVYVDITGRDPGSYVEEAGQLLREKLKLPVGYSTSWSGQYEAMQRVTQRLKFVVPLTLFLILLLLYANTRSLTRTFIVLLAVPFSAIGAIWLLYFLGYNMSVGVWVGLIALLGVDAETGVFMLLYLDLAYEQAKREGRLRTLPELQEAILQGAVKRLRPKFMTMAAAFLGLVPIMWSMGAGAEVMKHIAAPMVGGIITSFLLELLVYPAVYQIWKWNFEMKRQLVPETAQVADAPAVATVV
ncbi:MAG: CusA/CzcA family heavy metal efflux RND transporter [Candidatus Angelobacter sp. Gp1-AA117]|nr:MAG: CusA/CzcA family heavy metal efflux RND transporter [Candidatus Angelobacter sp. Gp1-AA117]